LPGEELLRVSLVDAVRCKDSHHVPFNHCFRVLSTGLVAPLVNDVRARSEVGAAQTQKASVEALFVSVVWGTLSFSMCVCVCVCVLLCVCIYRPTEQGHVTPVLVSP
jgi:hypothetical protein